MEDIIIYCPKCGTPQLDFDGRDVHFCDYCKFCRHTGRYSDLCAYCSHLEGEQESVVITLSDTRPESWNVLKPMNKYAWNKKVKDARTLILAQLRDMFGAEDDDIPMFSHRVDIAVICYFDKRPYDSSNIPLKLYEDGLIGLLIKNDSPKYVRRVSTESRIDRHNPRIVICVMPVYEDLK